MLAKERRERLLAEMRREGLEAIVVYGTSWQEAYLRYVSDFAILEGDGIAILRADGTAGCLLRTWRKRNGPGAKPAVSRPHSRAISDAPSRTRSRPFPISG